MLIFALLSPPLVQAADPPTADEQVQQALNRGEFSLAAKIAILRFRPDLHCRTFVEQAGDKLERAERLLLARDTLSADELARVKSDMRDARVYADQARALARNYELVGWEPLLTETVAQWLKSDLRMWDTLDSKLEERGRRGKPLSALMAGEQISQEDIERLPPEEKLVLGLHLVDRGEFDRAIRDCFSPVQLSSSDAFGGVAEHAIELLRQWPRKPSSGRQREDLVNKGLDVYEALKKSKPDQAELAGWYLSLISRLARDRFDVSITIVEYTLQLIEALSITEGDDKDNQMLAAKLRHERFLLSRRAEHWSQEHPPALDITLFREGFNLWYELEAELMAASASRGATAGDTMQQRCSAIIEMVGHKNEHLAAALQRRVDRLTASAGPFDDWLVLANSPEYQDRRGTVFPDVMIETRDQWARKIRLGFQERIAQLLHEQPPSQERIDETFQEAQIAKALVIGRTLAWGTGPLAPGAGSQARPISVGELLASNLMSQGTGGEMQIPRQELFIEYFVGPTRAWAWFVFVPGDAFEPMQVVELNREDFVRHCEESIASAQKGRAPRVVGDWLLGGEPTIKELWGRLEGFKKLDTTTRRLMIAPDGPLCYLPLDASGATFSAVKYLPTAAALLSSSYFNAQDLKLIWNGHRGEFSENEPTVRREDDHYSITLWPGANLPVHLQDVTD